MTIRLPPFPSRSESSEFGYIDWNNRVSTTLSGINVSKTKAGVPTTTDIPQGQWAVYKDTSGGTIKLYANDGGTIKSVTLT